jgi:hypothetical protein
MEKVLYSIFVVNLDNQYNKYIQVSDTAKKENHWFDAKEDEVSLTLPACKSRCESGGCSGLILWFKIWQSQKRRR